MQTRNSEAKPQKCSDEERKVKRSYNKNCILENNQFCILSPTIGPEPLHVRCQVIWMMDATWCGGQAPGGLVLSRVLWWIVRGLSAVK